MTQRVQKDLSIDETNRQKVIIERLKNRLAGKKLHYFITTLGCQMNVHDSEKIQGILEEIGYAPARDEAEADFVIYNTCAVRENAELKVYGKLGALKPIKKEKENMMIAVCGCMMQQDLVIHKLKKSFKHIDIVFGTHNLYKLAELIETRMDTHETIFDIWEEHGEIVEDLPSVRKHSFKASVNIMYGCNNFCAYCIVPYVRGRERSRPAEDILGEVEALAREGVVEIMLLGQNVNSYGKNLDEPLSFAKLLQMVEAVPGIRRIRFMTSHPKDLSDELLEVMKESTKLCRQLHLPVQSGSTKILKLMNRGYTKEGYLALVEKIKGMLPDFALTTDLIIGFPGETEEDVKDTLDIIEKVRYNTAYTYVYSKRTGTPAANMDEQVSPELIKKHFNQILKAVNQIAYEKSIAHIGKIVEILVEEVNPEDDTMLSGRLSDNHLIHFTGGKELIGQIIKIKIISAKSFYAIGEIYSGNDQT